MCSQTSPEIEMVIWRRLQNREIKVHYLENEKLQTDRRFRNKKYIMDGINKKILRKDQEDQQKITSHI